MYCRRHTCSTCALHSCTPAALHASCTARQLCCTPAGASRACHREAESVDLLCTLRRRPHSHFHALSACSLPTGPVFAEGCHAAAAAAISACFTAIRTQPNPEVSVLSPPPTPKRVPCPSLHCGRLNCVALRCPQLTTLSPFVTPMRIRWPTLT